MTDPKSPVTQTAEEMWPDPISEEDKPVHDFNECLCVADPNPHCVAMMPDNTFCCGPKDAPYHTSEELK